MVQWGERGIQKLGNSCLMYHTDYTVATPVTGSAFCDEVYGEAFTRALVSRAAGNRCVAAYLRGYFLNSVSGDAPAPLEAKHF